MISVIIPTYNREKLVVRAVESVLHQSSPNWECWVVDDFSTDNTKSIISGYCERDSRIHYCPNQHLKGAQGARNTGIERCNGNWILLLDSDNTISSDYIDKVFSYIQAHPSVDVVVNYIRVFDSNGTVKDEYHWIAEGSVLEDLLNENTYVDNSSSCIRKDKLFTIGLLDEHCPSYQEWDTHIRLSQICQYGTVYDHLTNYYDHDGTRISQQTRSIMGNGLYVLKKHRKLWISTVGSDVYARLLLHVFDQRKGLSFCNRIRVLFVVCRLSPKLMRQLIKRSFMMP